MTRAELTGRQEARLVLVADGDDEAASNLIPQLLDHGVDAALATDGADALLQVGTLRPDVLLVAADLPLLSGAAVVRALRRRLATPVLLGVGPQDAAEAVAGLAAGATACVARPYRIGEVLPLVAATRFGGVNGVHEGEVLQSGALRLDRGAHEVRLHGRVVPMPPKELDLLACLMRHAGHVVTHAQIRDEVWGGSQAGTTNTVVVHVRRLRARLGDAVGEPRVLLTVRGLGYRLVPPPAAEPDASRRAAVQPSTGPSTT